MTATGYFKNYTGVWVTVHLEDSKCRRGKSAVPATEDEWWHAERWVESDEKGEPVRFYTRCKRCMVRAERLAKAREAAKG